MSVEFLDTNILIYARDGGAGRKQNASIELIDRLWAQNAGALSEQVLAEFYSAATRKLKMSIQEAQRGPRI